MSELAQKKCVPCVVGVPPLSGNRTAALLTQLHGWTAEEVHHLLKSYDFPDFASALSLVNSVGAVAEREGNHPDIYLTWGKVRIQIWTHKIDGL